MGDVNSSAASMRLEIQSQGSGGKNSAEWANRQAIWDVLIHRTASGDQGAMSKLYDETSQLVYSLVLRIVGNPADAEEVSLDVYNQIWRTADRYSRDRGTVFAWIMNMARSRAIDHLRSRRNRLATNEPLENADTVRDAAEGPDRLSEVSQQRQRILAALAQLPADQKVCIELAFYSGLSHSELAQRLGEPLGTIKTRIRSGMLKLRSTLGELV